MRKKTYKTLVDYMERTGTHQQRLLNLVFEKTGVRISPQYFGMMLRGSRRMSAWNASAIHQVTGVPMDELTRWPRYAESENSSAVA